MVTDRANQQIKLREVKSDDYANSCRGRGNRVLRHDVLPNIAGTRVSIGAGGVGCLSDILTIVI